MGSGQSRNQGAQSLFISALVVDLLRRAGKPGAGERRNTVRPQHLVHHGRGEGETDCTFSGQSAPHVHGHQAVGKGHRGARLDTLRQHHPGHDHGQRQHERRRVGGRAFRSQGHDHRRGNGDARLDVPVRGLGGGVHCQRGCVSSSGRRSTPPALAIWMAKTSQSFRLPLTCVLAEYLIPLARFSNSAMTGGMPCLSV